MIVDEVKRREFERAWLALERSGTLSPLNGETAQSLPMRIEDFLPNRSADSYRGTLEELICIDIEFRHKHHRAVAAWQVEDYLSRFADVSDSETVGMLAQHEYFVRSRYAEAPAVEEYVRRFPGTFCDVQVAQDKLGTAPPAAVVSPGQNLGRYRLNRHLAQGGCGHVWLAYDPVLQREVALKTLGHTNDADERMRQRFFAEARTTAALSHPGVVSVHDLGIPPDSSPRDDQTPFYTMRLVQGETFADAIRTFHESDGNAAELAVERLRLLNSFLTVAKTIEFAHAQGVIHRDLKPQNIMLGAYGETAVLDWGLAKQTIDVEEPRESTTPTQGREASVDVLATQQGTVMGTPAYMSPEQLSGDVDRIDQRTDQFCLGAMLYHLLTGKPPFSTSDDQRHLPPTPRSVRRDTPPALEAICLRAMQPDPGERYESVSHLTLDVERFLADAPTEAYPERWYERVARWGRQHKTWIIAAASTVAVASLLLGVGSLILIGKNRQLVVSEGQATQALQQAQENLYAHRVSLAHSEVRNSNLGRAQELLKGCAVEDRNWEWYHVQWLIDQNQPDKKLAEVPGRPTRAAFSNDGQYLAVVGQEGTATAYRTRDWKPIAKLDTGLVGRAIAISPDNQWIVVGGSAKPPDKRQWRGTMQLYRLSDGERVAERRGHSRSIAAVTFSADSQTIVSGGGDGHLATQTIPDLERSGRWKAHTRSVRDLSGVIALPDGAALIASVATDGRVAVWDLATGTLRAEARSQTRRLLRCAASHDAAFLAAGHEDTTVQLWSLDWNAEGDPSRGEAVPLEARVVRASAGHTDVVEAVAISPDMKWVASGSRDRTVRLWDRNSGDVVRVVKGHTSHIRDVLFGPDGTQLVTIGDDGVAGVWDVERLTRRRRAGRYLAFADDSNLLAAGLNGLSIWDPQQSEAARRFDVGEVLAVRYAPGSQSVAVADLQRIQVLDTTTQNPPRILARSGGSLMDFVFSDPRTIVAVYEDQRLVVWNTETTSQVKALPLPFNASRLVMSPDRQSVILGTFHDGIVWYDLESERESIRHPADEPLLVMAVNRQHSLLATGDMGGTIQLFDAESGERLGRNRLGKSWLNCLAFSPDGSRLVSGHEHTVTFWDVATGREIVSMTIDKCIHNMAFSQDGRQLAVAGEENVVRIWSAPRGR